MSRFARKALREKFADLLQDSPGTRVKGVDKNNNDMRNKHRTEKNFISEEQVAMNQAACMNRIFRKVDEDGLSPDILKELGDDIGYVSDLYGIDPENVVLLAAILENTLGHGISDADLALYLGCTNIEFIRYHKNIREMEKAGIILAGSRMGNRIYKVSQEAMKAVEKNCRFTPVKMSGLSADDLFSRFRKLFQAFRKDSIDVDVLLEELDELVRQNEKLVFCRKCLSSVLFKNCSDTERRIFYYLCHRFVSHGDRAVSLDIVTDFTDFLEDDRVLLRHIAREDLPMQKNGLVCFGLRDGFADTDTLALTEKVSEDFFTEIEIPEEATKRHRDLISAADIPAKALFFNPAESEQIERLKGLLVEENFRAVQNRLAECGMRKGFNILLYGAPGTGKTASVHELARMTGRDIFHVDMSKLKSKWVGDSEKSVKGVFKIYRSLCHPGAKAPILLFNEADAIFSKRFENVQDSVDQMNNAIQNIILEEMESLDGILVATTNLLANLDPAFERRFIYKVQLDMPGQEARARIWESAIPGLSGEDAAILAGKYAFSGGNIENIARKSTVEYILSSSAPTRSSLEKICEAELLKAARTKIGF